MVKLNFPYSYQGTVVNYPGKRVYIDSEKKGKKENTWPICNNDNFLVDLENKSNTLLKGKLFFLYSRKRNFSNTEGY